MFLGHAPDLDRRWQIVIVTENLLFSLQDMLAMKLGLRFIRQGDAVTLAREQVGVDHILTVNRELLDSWRLSEFTMNYAARKEWFMAQWVALMADPYWKAPNISVPLFDLHDAHDSATYYE